MCFIIFNNCRDFNLSTMINNYKNKTKKLLEFVYELNLIQVMLILYNNYIIMYNLMTQFSVWSEIGISFAIIELRNTISQN